MIGPQASGFQIMIAVSQSAACKRLFHLQREFRSHIGRLPGGLNEAGRRETMECEQSSMDSKLADNHTTHSFSHTGLTCYQLTHKACSLRGSSATVEKDRPRTLFPCRTAAERLEKSERRQGCSLGFVGARTSSVARTCRSSVSCIRSESPDRGKQPAGLRLLRGGRI